MNTASLAPRATSSPNPVAVRLGHAALVPFVLGALLVWFTYEDAQYYSTLALAGYAAVVVSFLGGIHWGLGFRQAVPSPGLFAWGVVPALLAWVAVVMPAYASLVVLGVALIACYVVDRRVYPRHGAADWLVLRFRLTAVGSLSCFLGAAGS